MKDLEKPQADQIRQLTPANLNLAEAAAYVGVSVRKLWDEKNKSRIRCARIGRRLIFQKVELDRWLSVLSAASA